VNLGEGAAGKWPVSLAGDEEGWPAVAALDWGRTTRLFFFPFLEIFILTELSSVF
jgi:hypothetical protein